MLDHLRGRNHSHKPNDLDLLESASSRPPAREMPGSRFWLLPTVLLITAVILTPVLWIGLARVAGIPLGTVNDLSGLLATIGGVMGAIFAVGGLVIALVSVLTLLAIEDRVQATIGQLQPRLDERANLQIEANIAYLRATGERDWRVAQKLTNEALEKWSELKEARSFLAQRMADDVTSWFNQERLGVGDPSVPLRVLFPANTAAGYVVSALPSPAINPAYRYEEPPLAQAIHWLIDAIKHGEDSNGELYARLALMYGVNRQRPEMMEAIQQALRANPDLKTYLGSTDGLPMLVNALTAAPDLQAALAALGRTLDLTFPAPDDQVNQSVVAARTSLLISSENTFWLAIKKPDPGPISHPAELSWLHFLVTTGPKGTVGVADWMMGRPQQRTFPEDRSYTPIKDLVAELSKEFIFICAR